MNLLHDVVVDSSLVVSTGGTTPVSMKKEILKMFNNSNGIMSSSNSNSGITAGFFDSNYTEEDYPLPHVNSSSVSSKSSSGSSNNDHFLHAVIGGGNDAIAATSSNFRVDDTATTAVGDEHMTMTAIPIPPGQTIVQKPNPKDVLCGRGGRINSHPGNVYFRTLVEQYKHKYCDPGTKNVDKARMASSIVYNVRNSSSSSSSDAVVVGGGGGGRFLKEDQDSGYWVEIGDEKAIRKAAQALREMAPVLRHQTPPRADGKVKGGRGKADPPGPRHRPGPPKREGLMNNSSNERRNKNRSPAAATTSSTNAAVLPDDKILDRMRNEIRKMELLQAEQTRRMQLLQDMELYEIQRSCGQSEGSSSRGSNRAQTITNDHSNHSLHSSIEELGLTAREAIAALPLPPTKQHSVRSSGSGSSQSSHQEWDIQAEYLKMQSLLIQRNQLAEKLSAQQLKASSKCSSNERRGTAALRHKDQQQQWERNHYMQNKHHDLTSSSSIRNKNPFNRQYSSNLGGDDHTMYTLSSTGSATKSIDMSSLGGFTWNMWNNTSAISNINNNNINNSSGEERTIAMAASNSRTYCNSTLSSLEYKLENARQTQRCMEQKLEMQRMQQQQQKKNQQQRQQQKNLTASMNSLGIDDDESFRVSNMEFSEMDMSCFSNTTTTDHPSNSYSNMLQEYAHGNKGDTATSSRTNFRNHPTNNNTYTKAKQHGSSMVDDDDLLNASLKSLEISDNNFVGSTKKHDNMGADNSNNHEQNIFYQQQQHHQQHQQPGVNQHVCQQHSSLSVHYDMGISDVDFGISISSLKSIDVEYDDWVTSQQTKGMESINELVNPWETEDDNDDAAAANKEV